MVLCEHTMEVITVSLRRMWWVFGGIAASLLVAVIIFSQQTHAVYQYYSPFNANMVTTTSANPLTPNPNNPAAPTTPSTRVYHVIKNETTSRVRVIEFDTYYDTVGTNHHVEIYNRVPTSEPSRCAVQGTLNPLVTVTMRVMNPVSPATPNQTAVYRIPWNNICSPAATGGANARGTVAGRFFAEYPVPLAFAAGQVNRDPETSLYRVQMRIEYNPAVSTGATPNNQQILFKVRTDQIRNNAAGTPIGTCTAANCDRYIGSAAVTTGAIPVQNIATLGDTNSGSTGIYTQQRFVFGLPCTDTVSAIKRIALYDLDNGSTGGSWGNIAESNGQNRGRFIIQSSTNGTNWTSLTTVPAPSQYTYLRDFNTATGVDLGPPTVSPIGGIPTILPHDGSGVTTYAEFRMQPHVRYRIVVSPLYSNNIINLGLPVATRSVFGAIDCNVGLAGSITTNPAAGVNPIQSGRTLTISAESTRSGNLDFTSSYSSQFRVWYDTGDSAYNVADDGPTICNVVANRTHDSASPSPFPLGSCPNVVANTGPNGGQTVAICSQLILTRLATDTVTNITTGAAPAGLVRCFNIGKSPHLAALNGDVYGGGAYFTAGPCQVNNAVYVSGSAVPIGTPAANYSSYATYGVTSLGLLNGFGSNNRRANDVDFDALMFSSRLEGLSRGFFLHDNGVNANPPTPRQNRCLTNPFTTYGSRTTLVGASSSVDISMLATAGMTTGRSYNGGTLTITAPAGYRIPLGAKVIIYAENADVKIDNDIIYQDTGYTSIDQLPQVVILSNRDIIVDETVRQIDGVLAARRDVITCELSGPAITALRLNVCTQPLAVNGIAIAGNIIRPLRTYGAAESIADGTTYGTVAETFSLRPDTLLSQLPGPGSTNVYMRTVHENEAPPRY